MSDMKPDIETIDSRVVYENRWMKVKEDSIRRRDGSAGIYGFVDKPDFAVIIPFDGERLHLVQQFRYPIGQRQWEFPQGSWEEEPDAKPEELARGELIEETGLSADRVEQIGQLFPLYGTATQSYRIFFATGLSQGNSQLSLEEQDLVVTSFTVEQVEAMILSGELRDAATVAALSIAKLRGLIV
jgi:ADP-ribose pyrophosphatase